VNQLLAVLEIIVCIEDDQGRLGAIRGAQDGAREAVIPSDEDRQTLPPRHRRRADCGPQMPLDHVIVRDLRRVQVPTVFEADVLEQAAPRFV
jgi:hypothetical protein